MNSNDYFLLKPVVNMGGIDEDGNQANKTVISVPVKNADEELDNSESYESSKYSLYFTFDKI